MMVSNFDGVKVSGDIDKILPEEAKEYIKIMREKHGEIDSLNIKLDGDFVNIEWYARKRPFERIRRITGYLVGSLDKWNNGKRAEEKDRVKHG